MHILGLKSSPVQWLPWRTDLKQRHKKERRIKKSISPLSRASSRSLLLCWVWEQFFVFYVPWTPAVWKEPSAGAWLNSDSDFCAKGSRSVEPVPELKAHSEFLLNCWFFSSLRKTQYLRLNYASSLSFEDIEFYSKIHHNFRCAKCMIVLHKLCSKTKWTAC